MRENEGATPFWKLLKFKNHTIITLVLATVHIHHEEWHDEIQRGANVDHQSPLMTKSRSASISCLVVASTYKGEE